MFKADQGGEGDGWWETRKEFSSELETVLSLILSFIRYILI